MPLNLLNRTIQPSALQTTDAVGFLYLVTHVRTNCVTIRHQLWPQSVKHSKHYFELIYSAERITIRYQIFIPINNQNQNASLFPEEIVWAAVAPIQ